ncbi:hypothetical protein CBR_g12644 [Chara braunii]|uniref:Integrase catalytic domain-containing protein n=1 Tax=Chara braunii TaxID=69332 RepID=A0A388KSL1_CHABU|nr:hypothetical protein CBR_g12644 [Chara braunii]|eukprot:GBG72923.1 hypothetical protein CBR_g12644 [Chara braunii]
MIVPWLLRVKWRPEKTKARNGFVNGTRGPDKGNDSGLGKGRQGHAPMMPEICHDAREMGNGKETRPYGATARAPGPSLEISNGWEVSLPASYEVRGIDVEWRAVILGQNQTFMMVECLWSGMRFNRGLGDDLYTDLRDDENLGVDGDVEREEDALGDRESAKLPGAAEGSKEIVPGGSSGKGGGSKRGTHEAKEVRDKGSPTRQHLEGAEHKRQDEVLRVIKERKAAEGHRIPDEVAQTMKIAVEGFLTDQETRIIKEACQEFHLAFAFNDHQKGRLDTKLIPPVRIHTVEHECWNDKGPAYDFGIVGEVTELLREKMDSFVAEPTASPYANKWFVFRKPNKSLRWIQDLQKLNVVTIRDAGLLPQADLLAESHAGCSIYSLIDLYSGYDQLPLDARDRPYTAMHTPVGELQMQVTPMGFTTAVAEAQRRMLAVAGDMFPAKCEPYIDDNPVKGARDKDETEAQRGERSTARVFEPLRPMRVLGPGHLVHLDLAVMPVSTKGYRYILDARDNLSGFVEAMALKKKTGLALADWVEDFYLRHPFIRRFIADNGTEFVNQDVLNSCKRLGVPLKLIEPYHPEANSPVERGHQTLKNTISKLAIDDLGNWPKYLRQVVFAENVTPKRTTGCVPVELWYGREIDFPIETLVPTWHKLGEDPHLTTERLIEARCERAAKDEEALEEIVNRVFDSRMKDKTRWDQLKNIRKEQLQVGEMVLVRDSALESTWSRQLGRRFKGPYRITKRLGINTFEVEDLNGTSIKGSFPVQRLVRFLSSDPVEQ